MSQRLLHDVLEHLSPGQVQVVLCHSVTESLAYLNELESVLYGAISLHDTASAVQPTVLPQETKYTIFPVHGRPYPLNPGEQKLAALLAQDVKLTPLFQFNQCLRSVRLSQFLVDLL